MDYFEPAYSLLSINLPTFEKNDDFETISTILIALEAHFIYNFFIFLMFVLVAPNHLIITSDQGVDKITEPKKIGPFNEDSSLTLTCEVDKGKPIPTLQWFKNNRETGGE